MTPCAESSLPQPGVGLSLLDRVDYRLVETAEQRERIAMLRYRGYRKAGLIAPRANERFFDEEDDAVNAWTFAIYIDDELCSSVRIHILTSEWRTSMACGLFGDVLHPRLDKGEIFVDPGRLVADPEMARRFPALPYLTLRLAFMACGYFDAHTALALVRKAHEAFYQRVFMHEVIAGPRSSEGISAPMCLLATNYRRDRETAFARFPIMRSSAFERRMLFDRKGGLKAVSRPVLVGTERA